MRDGDAVREQAGDHAARTARSQYRFGHHDDIAEVAAGPAHFFGISQPEGRRLLVQVAGEFPLPLPQVEAGRYLVGGEVPDGLGQRCSFGGHERHGARLRRILGRDVKAAHAGSRV